ncbi:GAP family protein [Rhodococcus artemisiae]|uniref:GAP family protein n=1 Tax=Rhodococcus artemisiae TaxID=714159 RepID=A0ABU7L5D2_9NOCA|nr:GAP family protein [Rhodococcus artemisiae]MEE2056765.1 GAP family protein [Rhodococcus artemisiae]
MGATIGEILPLAVGVAISPIPIVAVILMLLSRNAKATSSGFGVGWAVGILAVTGIVILLAGSITPDDGGGSSTGWVKVVLGLLLIILAFKQWQSRSDTTPPKWMQAIDEFTFVKATGLGLALSAVNPKNLLLCVSAGVAIGTAGLSSGNAVVVWLVFTILAACSVLVPVIGYAVAAQRMGGALDSAKNWLQTNNHMVMAIVLLIMGATVVGKGLGGL